MPILRLLNLIVSTLIVIAVLAAGITVNTARYLFTGKFPCER